jgi:nitrogen-specific signal transduction histidine kinase
MEKTLMLSLILDSLQEEVVFVDTNHVIRYMNSAGKRHYARFGAEG